MWEENFIKEYNHWIGRLNKADKYFEDKTIDDNKKIKFLSGYNDIIKNLSRLNTEYEKKFNQKIPRQEKLFGFKC